MRKIALAALAATLIAALAAPGQAAPFKSGKLTRVTGPSPFAPGCEGGGQSGTNFENAEVEPSVAVDPTNPAHFVGAWQQDRWSGGSAHGVLVGTSFDAGKTWTTTAPHFSICAGGTTTNGGFYARATDPWVSFSPDGTIYVMALARSQTPEGFRIPNAMLVVRSTDGGFTWGDPTTLIRDTDANIFNDKNAITADPFDRRFVYAVWDRLEFPTAEASARASENNTGFHGPTRFTRSTDGGLTWESSRVILDPGTNDQTLGNQVVVMPNGTLVDGFDLIRNDNKGHVKGESVAIQRSFDRGVTWGAQIVVSALKSVVVRDPDTGAGIRTGGLPDFAVDPRNGTLYAVWEDSRFAGGSRDDVVFSMSTDAGRTWTAPARINKTTTQVSAFQPIVAVASYGTVGVLYYDFRSNTSAPGALTDAWFVSCASSCTTASNWSETHVGGPFDIEIAPLTSSGVFIGDYQGLEADGAGFEALFAMANTGNTSNRTDIFSATLTL